MSGDLLSTPMVQTDPEDGDWTQGDLPQDQSDSDTEIPTLVLPSGAVVHFRDLTRVTGENVRWLRQSRDLVEKQGVGSFLNDLMLRGMKLLVVDWTVCDPDGKPLRLPKDDPKVIDRMAALELRALEAHLRAPLLRLIGDKPKDSPGE